MAGVVLTNRCNLSCQTCFRPREDLNTEVQWSFGELKGCLAELAAVDHSFVFYTGGEPSLWRDGDVGFADLLAAAADEGLSPAFSTNGHVFRDAESTSALLDRYFGLTSAPLLTCVSVDVWHTGSWVNGCSPALDNVLEWRSRHGATGRLELELSSLCCLDETRNIPHTAFARYADAGVNVHYLPISPRGRAQELRPIAPALCPNSTLKASLGPYGEVLRQKMHIPPEEWVEFNNAELLGPCQAVDTLTLTMDRQYWLCNGRAGNSLRVAAVGELTKESISECLAKNPLVNQFRCNGFIETLRLCERGEGPITAEAVSKVMAQEHPFCVSGRASCGVCKFLPSESFH